MEKLEVGQVWKSGHRSRRIEKINLDLGTMRYSYKSTQSYPQYWEGCSMVVFEKWITRTGAKLEGRDGL